MLPDFGFLTTQPAWRVPNPMLRSSASFGKFLGERAYEGFDGFGPFTPRFSNSGFGTGTGSGILSPDQTFRVGQMSVCKFEQQWIYSKLTWA